MEARAGWSRAVGLAAGLALILAANYYLRHVLEESPRRIYSFIDAFYKAEIPIVLAKPWWELLLPLREFTGAWVTTTMLVTYQLEQILTPAGTWHLYNALAIAVAFLASWALFRSAVFSVTLGLCVGFGTQYYHAYAVAGGVMSYLMLTYNMLLLFTLAQVARGATPRAAWVAAFAASITLNALGYEGWLDVLVLVWVAFPFVYAGLRRLGRPADARRLALATVALTAAGAAYLIVKVTLGYGQTAGAESDVLVNYGAAWPMVDDLISNVFTHAYMSVSNFLPPALVGASGFYRLGADYLVEAQHDYHAEFSYLVPMHQVFFWRYYAGVSLVLLVLALYASWTRAWRQPSAWMLAAFVFLLMMLVAGPTHSLIKYRPMKSMPVMTYHVTVGVLGASLLLAWLAATAWRDWRNRGLAAAVVGLVWLGIVYSAFARPPYLTHMSAQAGLGEYLYPNPLEKLVQQLGGSYDPPDGLGLYQLMPYSRDEDLARLRDRLGDLPTPLPPVSEWLPVVPAVSVTPADGGVEVLGDDTRYGYQLMSPPVPVQDSARYLLRVRYDALEGRVCAGLLTGDQSRWVVPADGSTAEYTFDATGFDAVRVVLANCQFHDSGNPRTRFRVSGGSYATIAAGGATP